MAWVCGNKKSIEFWQENILGSERWEYLGAYMP
jgi:hypothetical protein